MKKIVFISLMIFLSILIFSGCFIIGGSKLSGLYESDGSGLVGSIRFNNDGTCVMRDSIMNIPTSYRYKVQGKTVVISGGGSTATLSIENDGTLEGKGLPFSSGQIFIKQ
jgi:hypothetical protein